MANKGILKVGSSKRKRSVAPTTTSIFDTVEAFDVEDENDDNNSTSNMKSSTPNLYKNTNIKKKKKVSTHQDDEDVHYEYTNDRLKHEREYNQAVAVQGQLNLYSRLIECRILIQRSMTKTGAATTNPVVEQKVTETAPTTSPNTSDASVDLCNQILVKLLSARQLLWQAQDEQHPAKRKTEEEYKHENDNDDSDITMLGEDYYQSMVNTNNDNDLHNIVQKEYDQHREYWKQVLNKRYYEIQLYSGKISSKNNKKQFTIIDTSFYGQVHSIVQHETMKYEQKQQLQQQQPGNNKNSVTYVLFDDTKIYQQMLNDFLTFNNSKNGKDSDSNNAILRKRKNNNGTQQQQALVDRKASKGRKIRYTVIPKLTNFTFPIQRQQQNNNNNASSFLMDEDVWFRSLFGSNHN